MHFSSVVQSSGMGKSRTVDELGKEHFSIPINLRDARSTGIFSSCVIVSFAVTNNMHPHLSRLPSCRPRGLRLFDNQMQRMNCIAGLAVLSMLCFSISTIN